MHTPIIHTGHVIRVTCAEPIAHAEPAARALLRQVLAALPCVYETDGRRHTVQRADERWTRRFKPFFARFG